MASTIEHVLTIFYLAGAKENDLKDIYGECEEYERTLDRLKASEKIKKARELCKLRNHGGCRKCSDKQIRRRISWQEILWRMRARR